MSQHQHYEALVARSRSTQTLDKWQHLFIAGRYAKYLEIHSELCTECLFNVNIGSIYHKTTLNMLGCPDVSSFQIQ